MIYESTGEVRVPDHGEYYLGWRQWRRHGKDYSQREVLKMWCCDECSRDWGKPQIIMRLVRGKTQ